MKKLAVLMMAFVTVILFTGCPGKEKEYVDLGTIPEKYLATVPYEDGQTFYLQHESDRVLIPFHVTRHRVKTQGDNVYGFDYWYDGGKYEPAPSVFFDCELDVTICKPDYPLFDIDIRFSNAYMADSVYYQQSNGYSERKFAALNLQLFYATIPFIGESTEYCTVLDSLKVNGQTYHQVFEFVNQQQDQGIYVKSLYYNYAQGVIAIYMSNGEKYLRYEEE